MQFFRIRLAVITWLGVSCSLIHGERYRSLVPVISQSVEFVTNENRVGLLESRGPTQIVHLPKDGADAILNSRQPKEERRISHVKASILTVGMFGMLVKALLPSPGGDNRWVGFICFWVLYMVEASTCSTRRYLSNICTPSEVRDFLHHLQKMAPQVRWDVECYHYEDPYTRMSSSRRGHDTRDKVVTHRASQRFWFQQWRDVTRAERLMQSLEYDANRRESYVKVTFAKLLLFAEIEHYHHYLAQQASFIVREGSRDFDTDSHTSIEVDGFIPKLLAVRTVLGSVGPIRISFFWLFTLLGLTVPYRIWFSRHCDEVDVVLTKEVTT